MTWYDDALCAGVHPDIFFEAHHRQRALDLCARCEVRQECLDDELDAMRVGVPTAGIRGGTIPGERHALLDRRLEPPVHGTTGGYDWHRRAGDTPCAACREARAARMRARRAHDRSLR